MIDDEICPETGRECIDCPFCQNEACNLCGAGCWSRPSYVPGDGGHEFCEHDVIDRHHGVWEEFAVERELNKWKDGLPRKPGFYWLCGLIYNDRENEMGTLYCCWAGSGDGQFLLMLYRGQFISKKTPNGKVWHRPLEQPEHLPCEVSPENIR